MIKIGSSTSEKILVKNIYIFEIPFYTEIDSLWPTNLNMKVIVFPAPLPCENLPIGNQGFSFKLCYLDIVIRITFIDGIFPFYVKIHSSKAWWL